MHRSQSGKVKKEEINIQLKEKKIVETKIRNIKVVAYMS